MSTQINALPLDCRFDFLALVPKCPRAGGAKMVVTAILELLCDLRSIQYEGRSNQRFSIFPGLQMKKPFDQFFE